MPHDDSHRVSAPLELRQLSSLPVSPLSSTSTFLRKLLSSLTYVDLSELPNVTDRELEKICDARDLETLIVDGTSVSERGFNALSRLTSLKELNLSGESFGDACLLHLSEAHGLTSIYTCNTRISDAGLRELGHLTELQYLALLYSKVSDESANRRARIASEVQR